jgi:hypothetical protein
MAVAAAAVLGLAYARRSAPPEAAPPPAPARPLNLAKIMDEGSLIRESPEEEFLRLAASASPVQPLSIDAADYPKETRRVLGALTDLFRRMSALRKSLKKTDPERYAAGMQDLKAELIAWMQLARRVLGAWDGAAQELLKAIQAETDPFVQENLGFLFRYLKPEVAGPAALGLAQSGLASERAVGIDALSLLHTLDAVRALVHRASADADVELQRRAIVGLGKSLSTPARAYDSYAPTALDALRQYLQPSAPAPLRAAAFDAYSLLPKMSGEDRELFMTAFRAEKDPQALAAARNAYQRSAARREAATERANRTNAGP